MSYTKAGMRAVDKYVKENYDRLYIKIPKGRKADVEAYAKSKGESINGLVNALLQNAMGIAGEEWKK